MGDSSFLSRAKLEYIKEMELLMERLGLRRISRRVLSALLVADSSAWLGLDPVFTKQGGGYITARNLAEM